MLHVILNQLFLLGIIDQRCAVSSLLRTRESLLLLLAWLSVGCIAMTMGGTLEPLVGDLPRSPRIPLVVGVYYSPEFQAYVHTRSNQTYLSPLFLPGGAKFSFPAGQNSVVLFDRALSQLFQSVVPVSNFHAKPADGLAGIIEPRIEDFDFAWNANVSYLPAYVIYRLTLYSLDGVPFASWTVTGADVNQATWEWDPQGKANNRALQNGVANFVSTFSDVPGVKAWLHRQGVVDAN